MIESSKEKVLISFFTHIQNFKKYFVLKAKKKMFFELVKNCIKQNNIGYFYQNRIDRLKSIAFSNLYSNKIDIKNKISSFIIRNLIGKVFRCLINNYRKKNYKHQRIHNSRKYYIDRLISKAFKSLKFILFKKQISDQTSKIDDKAIFKFFLNESKRSLRESKNKFLDQEKNNPNSIRNQTTTKEAISLNSINNNKAEDDLDNHKSLMDTYKNSHCSNVFSNVLYNKSQKNLINMNRNEKLEIRDFSNNESENTKKVYISNQNNNHCSNLHNDNNSFLFESANNKTLSKAMNSENEIDELLNNLQNKYKSISKGFRYYNL